MISLPTDQDHMFSPGQIMATPNAMASITSAEIRGSLLRHLTGDWGACSEEDRTANNLALSDGGRLFSFYCSANNVKFWIITEADRSATTVLLPEDY